MNFLKTLFSRIADAVRSFFQGPGGRIVRDAVAGAIETVGSAALAVLLEQATTKVAALEKYSNLSGDLKAAQVKSYLFKVAAESGIALTTSTANFILESAVQAVRGK